jgi:hypothetical protein
VRVATALSSKLVKALRKFLRHLSASLLNKFTAAFEEENGVRRAWNSDLVQDAERARSECARALAQLILVPQGLSVPGVPEPVFLQARVRGAAGCAAACMHARMCAWLCARTAHRVSVCMCRTT